MKILLSKLAFLCIISVGAVALHAQQTIVLSKDQLKDKIRGGWAGQTIGVTFGGPL